MLPKYALEICETSKDKYLDVYHTSKSKFFHLEDCHVNESENHQDEMKCCGDNYTPFVVYRNGSSVSFLEDEF